MTLQDAPQCSVPLICIHGGFGMATFHALARNMSPTQTVYGMQLFNTDLENTDLEIELLADAYADQILALNREKVVLAGYSVGGNIAHAIIRRLIEAGVCVPIEILINTYVIGSESVEEGGRPDEDDAVLYWIIRDVPDIGLDDALRIRAIFKKLRVSAAQYRPYPTDTPILLIQPQERALNLTAEDAARLAEAQVQAWLEIARSSLLVEVVDGSPGGMIQAPHVRSLAYKLQTHMDLVRSSAG